MSLLRDAINRMDFAKKSAEYDLSRSKRYWSSQKELFARTFEAYVKEKLADLGIINEYLVSFIDGSDVYPSKDNMKIIIPLFDSLIEEAKRVIEF